MRLRDATIRLGLVALVTVLTTGCGDQDLAALTGDPMATASADGTRLVDRFEEDASDGGPLGKPSPAEVRRTYAIGSEADPARVIEELQDRAEEVGWSVESVSPDEQSFVALRDIDGTPARLTVSLNSNPDLPPAPGVVVSLTAGSG